MSAAYINDLNSLELNELIFENNKALQYTAALFISTIKISANISKCNFYENVVY